MPTLHRDVSGQSAETTPLPNAARTPWKGPNPAPPLLRAWAGAPKRPHPLPSSSGQGASHTPPPPPVRHGPGAQPTSPHLSVPPVSSPGLAVVAAMVQMAPSLRHPQWEGPPPPSWGRGGKSHSTEATPYRRHRYHGIQDGGRPPPPSCGRRHAPRHAPRGGRGQAAAGLLGKLTNRNTKSAEGRAKD